jgi:hypothetical protein
VLPVVSLTRLRRAALASFAARQAKTCSFISRYDDFETDFTGGRGESAGVEDSDYDEEEPPEDIVVDLPDSDADDSASDDDEMQDAIAGPGPAPAPAPAAASAAGGWKIIASTAFVRQNFQQQTLQQRLRGAARQAVANGSEGGLFGRFISQGGVENIVRTTNQYVAQVKASNDRPPWVRPGQPWPPTWTSKWANVTRNELNLFFGVLYLMGIYRLPNLALWWRDAWPLTRTLTSIISRDRFRAIKTAIHFAEQRETPDGADVLYKAQSLLDHVSNNCRTTLTPGPHLACDEAVIRVESKKAPATVRYMKLPKPIGEGIVFDMVCDAGDSIGSVGGYVHDFLVRRKGGKLADTWRTLLGRKVGVSTQF